MKISHLNFYQKATADMRAVLDDVASNVEMNLRAAYEKQLAAQLSANISLPATTPEGESVVHGARCLTDLAVNYWDEIGKANYYFLKHMGNSNAAYDIAAEFRTKGLKISYF